MKSKTILITGGLGYVGGRLSQYFAEQDQNMVYSLSRNKTVDHPGIKVLTNDSVLIDGKLNGKKIDVIIHLAATNEIQSTEDPCQSNEVNINGTLKWLEWAKENQIGQFIYFSTVHVYARPLTGSFDENSSTSPRHPYSISHKCAEDYCNWYKSDFGLDVKIVRLSNSIGYPAFPTADRWTLFVNDICRQIAKNRSFKIHSNVKQHRDFISLSNVCSAVDTLIQADVSQFDNRIFNLSKGKSNSLEEMGDWIKKIAESHLNEEVQMIFDSSKNNESAVVTLSNSKLKSLGWNPDEDGLKEEITKTIDYFLSQLDK